MLRFSKHNYNYEAIKLENSVNVNIQKMMFANDIDISAVYLALFYTTFIIPHYAATRLLWIISLHIIITAWRLCFAVYESDYEKLNFA